MQVNSGHLQRCQVGSASHGHGFCLYRLLGETVTQSGEITRETLYTYDDASNRASKVEKENTVVVKGTTYTYNVANQLTAWSEEDGADVVQRSAVMTYDT